MDRPTSIRSASTARSLHRASTQSLNNIFSQSSNATSAIGSWLSRRSATPKRDSSMPQDPLCVMDIESSLFPNGKPDPRNPDAFHELHKNCISLIRHFQQSYSAKQLFVQDTMREDESLREEKKQAETHARDLQMQLDKSRDENKALREALEKEKQLHRADQPTRRTSYCNPNRQSASSTLSSDSTYVLSDRDSGFESDTETVADDVSKSGMPYSCNSPKTCPMVTSRSTLSATETPGGASSVMTISRSRTNDISDPANMIRENNELRNRIDVLEKAIGDTLAFIDHR